MSELPLPYSSRMSGTARLVGNDVNTDVIIPGRRLIHRDPFMLARFVMEDLDPEFGKMIEPGDIIVAGKNFGCGSSREQAPIAIRYAGISAVIAVSYARIFYRNSMNIGLPVIECPDIIGKIEDGDQVSIDLEEGFLQHKRGSLTEELEFRPIPEFLLDMLKDGGLVAHLQKQLRGEG